MEGNSLGKCAEGAHFLETLCPQVILPHMCVCVCVQIAVIQDRTGDLQIFSLTLSQLSYRGYVSLLPSSSVDSGGCRVIWAWGLCPS